MRDKLFHTREVLHQCLSNPNRNVKEVLEADSEAYSTKDELLQPLMRLRQSLIDTGVPMPIYPPNPLPCTHWVSSFIRWYPHPSDGPTLFPLGSWVLSTTPVALSLPSPLPF